MTTDPLDLAEVMRKHPRNEEHFCFGAMLAYETGCLVYRLAERAAAAEAKDRPRET